MTDEHVSTNCPSCGKTIEYRIIHNGFNESAHAYCDKCGMTCVLNDASPKIPRECRYFERQSADIYRIIDKNVEKFLQTCKCGGNFRHDALPRCPHCKAELTQFKDMQFRTVVISNNRVDDCWITKT